MFLFSATVWEKYFSTQVLSVIRVKVKVRSNDFTKLEEAGRSKQTMYPSLKSKFDLPFFLTFMNESWLTFNEHLKQITEAILCTCITWSIKSEMLQVNSILKCCNVVYLI